MGGHIYRFKGPLFYLWPILRDESTEHVKLFRAKPFGFLLPLLLLCMLALFKKVWLQRRPLTPMTQPKLVLFRWLLKGSELIEGSLYVRVSVAVLSLLLLYFMSSERVVRRPTHQLLPQLLHSPTCALFSVLLRHSSAGDRCYRCGPAERAAIPKMLPTMGMLTEIGPS